MRFFIATSLSGSLVLLLCVAGTVVEANNSSCGGDRPSKVLDCDKVDMGSCGNACCGVDIHLPYPTDVVYTGELRTYLEAPRDLRLRISTNPDAAPQVSSNGCRAAATTDRSDTTLARAPGGRTQGE